MIEAFDRAVDKAIEPYRDNPTLDTAARLVSNLADYGFAWSLVAATKGRRRGPRRIRARRALAVAGVSSAIVNAAVKQAVARRRPAGNTTAPSDGASGVWVRTPSSSSFPSGHTLAAACTAVVLAETPGQAAAYLTFAASVGASRVYVRAHHASDVVGGAAIGVALGVVGRFVVYRWEWRGRRTGSPGV